MHKLLTSVSWIFTAAFIALLTIMAADYNEWGMTGYAVASDEDTGIHAPPFDVFTGSQIILLTHRQLDAQNFEVEVDINQRDAYIYENIYYLANDGWRILTIDNDWSWRSKTVTIDDTYADFTFQDGDDLYVAVWTCKARDDEWKCGCKSTSDCGYWHVQGVDLEEEVPLTPCIDDDGDGYGSPANAQCTNPELDCDDSDPLVNPGFIEVAYNSIDDDCDPSTPDDDIDGDGYLFIDDCLDTDPNIHPGADELCGDDIDQDCSGSDETCVQCGEGSIPMDGCDCGGSSYYGGFCCDNVYRTAACGTPEVIFYDGFESGSANTWDYLNPQSDVNRDNPHDGQYGLNLIYSPGSYTPLNRDQYASTSLPEERRVFIKYYVNFESDFIHPLASLVISTVSRGSSDWSVELFTRMWQGDVRRGRLWMRVNGQEYDTGKVLNTNRWYCIEQEVFTNDAGNSNGVIRTWVDSSLGHELTSAVFADGDDIDHYEQGGFYDGNFGSVPIISYVDDVVVSKERVGC